MTEDKNWRSSNIAKVIAKNPSTNKLSKHIINTKSLYFLFYRQMLLKKIFQCMMKDIFKVSRNGKKVLWHPTVVCFLVWYLKPFKSLLRESDWMFEVIWNGLIWKRPPFYGYIFSYKKDLLSCSSLEIAWSLELTEICSTSFQS